MSKGEINVTFRCFGLASRTFFLPSLSFITYKVIRRNLNEAGLILTFHQPNFLSSFQCVKWKKRPINAAHAVDVTEYFFFTFNTQFSLLVLC